MQHRLFRHRLGLRDHLCNRRLHNLNLDAIRDLNVELVVFVYLDDLAVKPALRDDLITLAQSRNHRLMLFDLFLLRPDQEKIHDREDQDQRDKLLKTTHAVARPFPRLSDLALPRASLLPAQAAKAPNSAGLASLSRYVRPQMIRALLLFLLLTAPARAELVIPLPPIAGDWPAIGRTLNPAKPEGGFCTGTLVAPNLVLTAAHCAPKGGPEVDSALEFYFGDPKDPETLRIPVAYGLRHPTYNARGSHAPAKDLGFIILEDTAPVEPLPLGTRTQSQLALIGFHKYSPAALTGRLTCPLTANGIAFLRLGCPVASGNSGSPILQQTPTGWQIVAVASSKSGRQVLAPPLDDWVFDTFQSLTN